MAAEVRMGFIMLCFLLAAASAKESVPVLIWTSSDLEGSSPPALKQLSTQQFSDQLSPMLEHNPLVLIFIEESLSLEDFSGEQFPKLQELGKSTEFLPRVQSPLKALKKYTLGQTTLEEAPTKGLAVVVIKMDDARPEEDRHQLLRRHDARMYEVFSQAMKKRKDVVAFYTGRYTSWTEPEVHRVRRLLEDTAAGNSTNMILKTELILVFAKEMPTFNFNGKEIVPSRVLKETADARSTHESLLASFIISEQSTPVILKFLFFSVTPTAGYWSLVNVTVSRYNGFDGDQTFSPDRSIVAPVGFSYHCTAETVLKDNNGSTIRFVNFQAQPFLSGKVQFSDAYNCELFFTAPIWSGLFVMSILASIMIWGLIMIMDIRTMDQFDDPKGKTITISAVE